MNTLTEAGQWSEFLGVAIDANSVEICAAFERRISSIIPELSSVPFYCVPLSTLPPQFHAASENTGGWYSPLLYHWTRDFLSNDRGPGAAFIVNDVPAASWKTTSLELAQAAQQLDKARGGNASLEDFLEVLASHVSIELICSTATHELAHAILSAISGDLQDELEIAEWRNSKPHRAKIFHNEVNDLRFERSPKKCAPIHLSSHSSDYVRCLAHIDRRLQTNGVRIEKPLDSSYYGHEPWSECVTLLENELCDTHAKSLRRILLSPIPSEFERATTPSFAAA